MTETADRKPPGNAEARVMLSLVLIVGVALIFVIAIPDRFPRTAIVVTYGLVLSMIPTVVIAARFAGKGTEPVRHGIAATGIVYLAGGAMFDMFATIRHSPNLELEGNVLARTLLDSGHSLGFVYTYAFLGQSLLITIMCTFWVALIRHRDILRNSIDNRSALRFFQTATGGRDLTFRQWLIPLRMSELPHAYHLFWIAYIMLFAGAIDRWYLGCQWYGLFSLNRWVLLITAFGVGLVGWFVWLWRMSSVIERTAPAK